MYRTLGYRAKRFCNMVLLILTLFSFLPDAAADAAGTISAQLELPQDSVKANSNITVYLVLSSDEDIGAVSGEVSYDSSALTLKGMTIEQKSKSDYLQYSNKDGSIAFICMNKNEQTFHKRLCMTFSQSANKTTEYHFSAAITEALNKQSSAMNISGNAEAAVRVEEKVSPVSESSRKTRRNTTVPQNPAEAPEEAAAEYITEYSVVFEDSDGDPLGKRLIIVAFAAVLAVTFAAAYRLGRHTAKTEEENIQKE